LRCEAIATKNTVEHGAVYVVGTVDETKRDKYAQKVRIFKERYNFLEVVCVTSLRGRTGRCGWTFSEKEEYAEIGYRADSE